MTGAVDGGARLLLDLLPQSVVLRRRDGVILAWNAASETLYGIPAAAAIGGIAAALFGDGAEAPGAMDSLGRTGAWQGDVLRPGADGGQRVVELHWRLQGRDEIVETGRDVTADRQAREALARSEHRYRNLFQAMAASFWELDFFPVGAMLYKLRKSGEITDYRAYFAEHPELIREMMRATRVIDVNEQTVALFGRGDKAELLTTVDPFWPEASTEVYAESVVAAVTGAPHYTRETVLRTIDGREFPALFTACFPADTMNKGTLLVGVIDLTERVAAQTALARMQKEMAHAARVAMLGELTASIAHEINQPLGAIAANAAAGQRWLDRAVPDLDEVRGLTDRIAADAFRAAEIIRRVRAMASGGPPEPAAVNLNLLMEDTATFLQHEIRQAGVRLRMALDPDLPAIRGDRIQLQQIVVNLAMNAIQAMAQSHARALTLRTGTAVDRVSMIVEDSGPGIAEENLPTIFDSFFTTREAGMGMGLAIARTIVTQHGGTIAAANIPSGGARFRVDLPIHTEG